MKNSRVFIITVVHNAWDDLYELFASLEVQKYSDFEIFVVDDGSDISMPVSLSKFKTKVTFLKGDGGLWWTGGLYLAVEAVLKKARDSDFILTMNTDTTVEKSFISQLVDTARKYPQSIIGSLAVNKKNNLIWDSGIKINWSGGLFYPASKASKKDSVDFDIDALTTKGTLYPVEVFKNIGNFDKKNFPHYFSDYEFAIRAKKAGFKLGVDYRARVFNDVENTGIDYNSSDNIYKTFFSRKSKVNIFDHLNFVRLHVPLKYKFKWFFKLAYTALKLLFKR